MHLRPIPESQAPLWRGDPATGEQIVALHGLQHGRTGKEINIDPCCSWHLDQDAASLLPFQLASFLWCIDDDGVWTDGLGRFGVDLAAIKFSVTERIDQHAISVGGDIERDRRVRVARVAFGVSIDANDPLVAALLNRKKLQTEAVRGVRRRQGEAIDGIPATLSAPDIP